MGSQRMLIHVWRKRLLTVGMSPNVLEMCICTNLRRYMNVVCSSPWGWVMFVAPLYVLIYPLWKLNHIMPYCMIHDMCAFDLSWKSF